MAVSGGSDSTALLVATARWATARRSSGRRIEAATVDHRLRPDSATEAAQVAQLCKSLGIPHTTLVWDEAPGSGNLQAAARGARQRLLGDWAKARALGAVLLGHTMDDQAETVLLRLARGSGVDGLSAMAARIELGGTVWHRPLLALRRGALRAWLRGEGIGWTDDPSNEDLRFDRVRARQALVALAPLGIDAERLAETAARLSAQRNVLETAAEAAWVISVRELDDGGKLSLDVPGLAALDETGSRDTVLRVLARVLMRVSGAGYRPRHTALRRLWEAVRAPDFRGATLSGCLIRPVEEGKVEVSREP